MKLKNIIIYLMIGIISLFIILPIQAEEQNPAITASKVDLPVIFAPESTYVFNPVAEGTEVLHDFVIENTGGKPLSIEKVTTSCGCTTADYTKEIPPGEKGKISIKANTNGYAGHKFAKSITVYSNDPNQKTLNLNISGDVEKIVSINPEIVKLEGVAGQQIRFSVTIIPEGKYPFNIIDTSVNNGKNCRFNLEKKADRYVLTVENLLETKGKYFERIILKTDNPVKSEISIRVYGNIS